MFINAQTCGAVKVPVPRRCAAAAAAAGISAATSQCTASQALPSPRSKRIAARSASRPHAHRKRRTSANRKEAQALERGVFFAPAAAALGRRKSSIPPWKITTWRPQRMSKNRTWEKGDGKNGAGNRNR